MGWRGMLVGCARCLILRCFMKITCYYPGHQLVKTLCVGSAGCVCKPWMLLCCSDASDAVWCQGVHQDAYNGLSAAWPAALPQLRFGVV
jgi:hypothetical protein